MTLISKLIELRKKITGLQETGYNDFSRYNYSTEADLLNAYVDQMLEVGLYFLQDVVEQDITMQEFGEAFYSVAKLRIKITIIDAETGEKLECHFPGFNTDKKADKAAYKALTGGIKYGMKKILHLDSGIDGDADNGSLEETTTTKKPAAKKSTAKKPAAKKPATKKPATKKPAAAEKPAKKVTNSQKLALASECLGYGREAEYWVVQEAAMQYWQMSEQPERGWAEAIDDGTLTDICKEMWAVVAADNGHPNPKEIAERCSSSLNANNFSSMSTAFKNALADSLNWDAA